MPSEDGEIKKNKNKCKNFEDKNAKPSMRIKECEAIHANNVKENCSMGMWAI